MFLSGMPKEYRISNQLKSLSVGEVSHILGAYRSILEGWRDTPTEEGMKVVRYRVAMLEWLLANWDTVHAATPQYSLNLRYAVR